MFRLLVIVAFSCLPHALWAACGGTDLRVGLSEAARAEIDRRLAGVPFAEGNHWRATRGDRQIDVIGTMHVDDPRFDAVTRDLAEVIESADILLVEADKAEQTALQTAIGTNPDLIFLRDKTLIDLLPDEEWKRLSDAAAARGVPSFMAAKFKPWYLSLMLAMSPCTMKSMASGAKGLDQRLMDMAEAAGVRTASLEPYDTVFQLFANDPLEVQIKYLMLGLVSVEASEDANATLVAQYFEQAHMNALETSRVSTRLLVDMPPEEFDAIFDEVIGLLVDKRNASWIAPIEAAEGDRIVVAAGALHLGGEAGLLNLLKNEGYTLERQPF